MRNRLPKSSLKQEILHHSIIVLKRNVIGELAILEERKPKFTVLDRYFHYSISTRFASGEIVQ